MTLYYDEVAKRRRGEHVSTLKKLSKRNETKPATHGSCMICATSGSRIALASVSSSLSPDLCE